LIVLNYETGLIKLLIQLPAFSLCVEATKMKRDFARTVIRVTLTIERCTHLSRASLAIETHKADTNASIWSQEGTRKVAGVAVCMCGQAVGEARAHTRIHFQTHSFRDHKTQAHWTIIVSRDSREDGGVLHLPFLAVRRSLSLDPASPLFPIPMSSRLPFSPICLSHSFSTFVRHPFSPSSPSNSFLIPLRQSDRWYRTCVRLRTRRYYLLLRFTTDTRVLLRAVAYRRPFAPTFAPRTTTRFLLGNFREGEGGSAHFATTRFMHAISSRLPRQVTTAVHTESRVVTYLFYLLASPISLFPSVEFYLTAGFLLFKLRMMDKEYILVHICTKFFLLLI